MSDLSFQVRAPLGLTLSNGEQLTVTSWSLAGIDCPGDHDILPAQGVLAIPFQGVDIQFPVNFRRDDPESRFLTFEGLSGRQRETLAVFYRSILSGRMASTEEIITSLDTPVDLVPMEETEEEKAEATAGKTPRTLRVLWSVALYLSLAVLVFGTLGSQIIGKLTTIGVAQARVEAPLVPLVAPESSFVERVRVAVGDKVRQGDTLVTLSDPRRNARVNELRTDISAQEARISEARAVLRRHMTAEDRIRAELLAAYLAALSERTLRDFLGDYDLYLVRTTLERLHRFDDGYPEAPGDFHDVRRTFKDALQLEKDELARLKRRLGAEKDAGRAMDVVAPSDGVVTSVPVFRDQFLSRGALTAEIEENSPRVVMGWLDEAYADIVHPGMSAVFTFNTGGQKRRKIGVVTDIVAGVDPDRPGEYGLMLTVAPEPGALELLRPDAPVEMRLDRAPSWLTTLRDGKAWVLNQVAVLQPVSAGA